MRGDERVQDEMFSCVTLEQRVPQEHPLREIRRLTDAVLVSLNDEFDRLYSASGRPSIAPEYVLRALLLQAFYSVRSERQLVEQLEYNLLFRWFVGLGMDDVVWNHAVFSKNRDRLLTSEVAQRFFAEVNRLAKRFMSDEHFTVDGTLIQAWASQKSFRRKDGSDDGDGTNFRGRPRHRLMPTFALCDANNFYCSCERVFAPHLRGVPVVVLSNNDGCCIARSQEAKDLDIKMGDPWFKIEKWAVGQGVRRFSSNYVLYGDMSRRLYEVLQRFAPHVEPYSIDEMFLDLGGLGVDLVDHGRSIRAAILRETKIPTCVGSATRKRRRSSPTFSPRSGRSSAASATCATPTPAGAFTRPSRWVRSGVSAAPRQRSCKLSASRPSPISPAST